MLASVQVPKKNVEDENDPVTGLNLNTWVLLGSVLEKRAATVFVAPSSGFDTNENPGGKLTFTNPTALTEYTVWAREEAAVAASISPAARSVLAFMSLVFPYLVCSLFVADNRFPVNGFFLRTLP